LATQLEGKNREVKRKENAQGINQSMGLSPQHSYDWEKAYSLQVT
jgi:hypothetical protein